MMVTGILLLKIITGNEFVADMKVNCQQLPALLMPLCLTLGCNQFVKIRKLHSIQLGRVIPAESQYIDTTRISPAPGLWKEC